jgi:hypothetical protein
MNKIFFNAINKFTITTSATFNMNINRYETTRQLICFYRKRGQ